MAFPLSQRLRAPSGAAWIAAVSAALALPLPCAAAAPGIAYVSSEKDNTLTLIDLKTQAVTGTIATCKRPRHLQLVPGGAPRLMAACGDSNAADIIDLDSGKSVGRVPLGADPEVFDFSPDGKTIYVSNEDDGELSLIDTATGKKTASVKVGQEPEGVKVTPDGKTVYVASEVANLVHVIDTASLKVIKNIKVGKRPRRFALSPDGKQLWVTSELDASVSVISTADYQVIDTIRFEVKGMRPTDITPVGIAMTRDGKRAFVALGKANHVAFIDVPTRKVTDLVLVGRRPWGVSLDKQESRLFVANSGSDDVTIVDLAGAKALKTVSVGRVPYAVLVVE